MNRYSFIGRFVPSDTILHKLDARAKLLCMLFFLGALISASTLFHYLFLIILMIVVIKLAGMNASAALSSIRKTWLFFLFVFLMNALFFQGEETLFDFGIFHISKEGILQGGQVVLTVVLVMILGNILTYTTAPMALTKAIASFISPLRIIKIPTDDIAMIIGAAFTFIPTLLEEFDMIKKAQIARGARFESKRLRDRIQALFPLVIPVFLSAFKRADELSLAMESRGYRQGGQQRNHEKTPFQRKDYLALLIVFILFSLQFVLFL
ncbi:energy-coupling factor transporter transmembrane protein EcfT [Lachnospiraceae bacterium OttesenSCG-928-D06]|nr:energy-coupling factor transporter transmembrane protein EcfT [Lachnospiraceae bacterium OttesenSCG-928-D06]